MADVSEFTRRELLLAGAAGGVAALGACSRGGTASEERIADTLGDLEPDVGALPSFPPDVHVERRGRLQRVLSERGLDAILLGPTVNLTYFTGTTWRASERLFGCVVFADGGAVFIAAAFEEARVREAVQADADVRVWQEDRDPHALVMQLVRERARGRESRLAVDSHLRATHTLRLAGLAPAGTLVDGLPVTGAVRSCKSEAELFRIQRACEITQQAIGVVRERFCVTGVTEEVVKSALSEAQRRLGLSGTWCLALFGPNAAFPHGTKDRRPLEAGQMVLVDTGGELDGYQSDVSRTFVVGADATKRQRLVYSLVRDAQKAAVAAMGPGVPCSRVDAAAREVIVSGGFGPSFRFFTHRLGHGIGLEGHEEPYFCGNDDTPLAPGMTLSNEPGIYVPGELGVRLEDIVALTDTGPVTFGTLPPDSR